MKDSKRCPLRGDGWLAGGNMLGNTGRVALLFI